MKKVVFVFFSLLIFTTACHKKHEASPTQNTNNYLPLKVGNYWIYQTITINNSDTINDQILHSNFREDSLCITGDTIIKGNTYYIFKAIPLNSAYPMEASFYPTLLRDSADFIVDNFGKKWVSSSNYTDTLSTFQYFELGTEFAYGYYKIGNTDTTITVPAGTFTSADVKKTEFRPSFPSLILYGDYFYTKNVGITKIKLPYLSGGSFQEAILVRYKIN